MFWGNTIQPIIPLSCGDILFCFCLVSVAFFFLVRTKAMNVKFTEMIFMLMGQLRIIIIKRQLCLLNHVYFPSSLVVPCGEKNFPLTLSNLAHVFSLNQCLKYPFTYLSQFFPRSCSKIEVIDLSPMSQSL